MDFMKHLSRSDCAYLDSLPQERQERIWNNLIRGQEYYRGLLSVHELGEILSLGKDGVSALPLRFTKPFRKTTRGMRQVRCVHRDDLVRWLTSLNESFCDFDPTTEKLLKPSEIGPDEDLECVRLSARTRRFRRRTKLADLIME